MTTRNRIALIVFAVLGAGSIVVGGVFAALQGDTRVLVVTLEQGVGQGVREQIRDDCGSLPGIAVVPDRGNPDPAVQGRFPIRFRIGGTTTAQEAALQACLGRYEDVVRGSLPES